MRRKKRKILVTVLIIIIYVVVILALMRLMGVQSIFNKNDTSNTDSNSLQMNADQASITPTPLSDEGSEALTSDNIPNSLIELAKKNPETIEFVENYPEHSEDEGKIDISEDVNNSDGIPLFIQWDIRWGYKKYGGDYLAVTGCGPTCLSMVRCGLGKDTKWNPYKVAKKSEKEGFYVEGQGSSWELMTTGAMMIGLEASEVIFDKNHIENLLRNNTPIICAMRAGDFTTTGHFIVLVGIDEDGAVWIHDPNSPSKSNRSWTLDELMPQIKNLWSYSLK